MTAGDKALQGDAVDRVINQVLRAEEEARLAVARCRTEAERILAAAEQDARRVAERTEARITLAHRIADRAVEQAYAAAERFERPDSEAPISRIPVSEGQALSDQRLLGQAVDALVDEIIAGRT